MKRIGISLFCLAIMAASSEWVPIAVGDTSSNSAAEAPPQTQQTQAVNKSGGGLAEWIVAVASAISAFTIIVLAKQTGALREQTKALRDQVAVDNERARREQAVELLKHWAVGITRESSSARKFVHRLNADQTKSLFSYNPIRIEKAIQHYAENCLGRKLIPEQDGRVSLDEGDVATIRWFAVSYLNSLESVMVAWRHNVADRQIIEEQFRYLNDDPEVASALERVGDAAGGRHGFPALFEFAATLRAQTKPLPPEKKPL